MSETEEEKITYERVCVTCGTHFMTKNIDGKYCRKCGKERQIAAANAIVAEAIGNENEERAAQNRMDCIIVQTGTASERVMAEDRLVKRNKALMGTVTRKFIGTQTTVIGMDDIEQQAYMGILEAAKRYDPEEGAFSTYAVIWMRQQILSFIRDNHSFVRIPSNANTLFQKAKRKHENTSGADFYKAIEDDDSFTESQKESIKKTYNLSSADSTDRPVGDSDEDGCLGDFLDNSLNENFVPVEDAVTLMQRNAEVRELVKKCLPANQLWVITRRYGLDGEPGWTLDKCGENYPYHKVTRERIRQIENKAYRRLKVIFEKEGIQP